MTIPITWTETKFGKKVATMEKKLLCGPPSPAPVKYGKGTKCFLDGMAHAPKGVCVEVKEPGKGWEVCSGRVAMRVTADSGPYRKGETLEFPACRIVPLKQRYVRGHLYRINTGYVWE